MSFVGSKEFKGMNWIHYPYDFIAIIVVTHFYKIGSSSHFNSIYFKRAKKINKMKDGSPEEAAAAKGNELFKRLK